MEAAFGVAAFGLVLFLLVRTGLIKSWFVAKRLPGLLSARMIYALLPMSVGFLLGGLGAFFSLDPRYGNVWVVSIFVCWFLGFLYMMWPPRLIKPRWLQWLEKEYGYGLDILVEEAQKMGRWRWEARVHDQQGLESWAQEVLRRRQQDMDEAWKSWLTHQAYQNGERMFRKYRGDVPPDRLLDPYKLIDVPEHRNEDFHQYLMGPRQAMLFALIDSFEPGRAFTIADLRQACPGITDKLIRWVLDGFRARGEVECAGRGRTARWRRV